MLNLLLQLIEQLNSAVFVLMLLLIISFLVVWKLSDVVSQFRFQKEKNKKIDDNLDSIKDNMASVKATTDLLYQNHLQTVKSHSPMSLTEKGQQIADQLNLPVKVQNHWQDIKSAIDKLGPSNPYDIQVIALDSARSCFDQTFTAEERDEIKLHAYKIGMNLLEIYPIIGILIRDKYLQEKGIDIGDIDKHDPRKH